MRVAFDSDRVDLYGTAVILEEFGNVIAVGGSGVVIASQSGHRLPALTPEQDKLLALTPAEELLALPMLQPDKVTDPLQAYQLSQARQLLARDGGSRALGQTQGTDQHDQPWDHHQAAREPMRKSLPLMNPPSGPISSAAT